MHWIKNLALVLVSTLVLLLLLELVLRFLPVNDVSRNRSLAQDDRPLQVSSRPGSSLNASFDWDFKNARSRLVNNYGFFADYDYRPGWSGPVVIGDSYVEAVQVPFTHTFHQLLAERRDTQIYNFGLSGAPLSQYEAYLGAVCGEFAPSQVIIPIIDNDFDESLYKHRQRDGFFHYRSNGTLQATPYAITPLRRMANASSLIKYVYFNLHVGERLAALAANNEAGSRQTKVAQSPAGAVDRRLLARRKAAHLFLRRLRQYCVAPEDILLVLDADRNAATGIYSQQPQRSTIYTGFASDARAAGYQVLDLQPLMLEHYRQHQQRFEFAHDGHWNGMAHEFVANAIADSGFLHGQ